MKLTMIFTLLFTLNSVFGQLAQKVTIIDNQVNPGLMLDEVKLPPAGIEGTVFYDDGWHNGKVFLKSGQVLVNFPIRYDVENYNVEIRSGDDVKVCSWSQYFKFEWLAESREDSMIFVNSNHFVYRDGTPPIGAVRILYDGRTKLLALPYVKILKSNYAPTVDIGSRDNKMVHRDAFMLYYNGIVTRFNTKKELLVILKKHSRNVKDYIKKHKLKVTNGDDLVKLIEYFDSL